MDLRPAHARSPRRQHIATIPRGLAGPPSMRGPPPRSGCMSAGSSRDGAFSRLAHARVSAVQSGGSTQHIGAAPRNHAPTRIVHAVRARSGWTFHQACALRRNGDEWSGQLLHSQPAIASSAPTGLRRWSVRAGVGGGCASRRSPDCQAVRGNSYFSTTTPGTSSRRDEGFWRTTMTRTTRMCTVAAPAVAIVGVGRPLGTDGHEPDQPTAPVFRGQSTTSGRQRYGDRPVDRSYGVFEVGR